MRLCGPTSAADPRAHFRSREPITVFIDSYGGSAAVGRAHPAASEIDRERRESLQDHHGRRSESSKRSRRSFVSGRFRDRASGQPTAFPRHPRPGVDGNRCRTANLGASQGVGAGARHCTPPPIGAAARLCPASTARSLQRISRKRRASTPPGGRLFERHPEEQDVRRRSKSSGERGGPLRPLRKTALPI